MMKSSPSASIELKEGTHFAKVVLMPGDPLRAKYIADHYLENPVLVNDVRNMLAYTGTYEGKEISVMGSGMGVPSIVLYSHELFHFFDVEAIIRVGSAGGLAENVHVHDLVVAMTASTNSACVTAYGLPGVFSPCADYEMLQLAEAAAAEVGVKPNVGNVYTSDFFYHPNKEVNQRLRDEGVLAVEMETAGLYLEAAHAHKRALTLLTISDHIFTGEALSAEDRQNSFHNMMEVALKTGTRVKL